MEITGHQFPRNEFNAKSFIAIAREPDGINQITNQALTPFFFIKKQTGEPSDTSFQKKET